MIKCLILKHKQDYFECKLWVIMILIMSQRVFYLTSREDEFYYFYWPPIWALNFALLFMCKIGASEFSLNDRQLQT